MKYMHWTNKTERVYRPPLRTLEELAAEFGVAAKTLQGKLTRRKDAPSPALRGRNNAHKATWYNPDEVRKWWNAMAASQSQHRENPPL